MGAVTDSHGNGGSKCFSAAIYPGSVVIGGQTAQQVGRMAVVPDAGEPFSPQAAAICGRRRGRTGWLPNLCVPALPARLVQPPGHGGASWNSGSERERIGALAVRRWRVRTSAPASPSSQGHGDRTGPRQDTIYSYTGRHAVPHRSKARTTWATPRWRTDRRSSSIFTADGVHAPYPQIAPPTLWSEGCGQINFRLSCPQSWSQNLGL